MKDAIWKVEPSIAWAWCPESDTLTEILEGHFKEKPGGAKYPIEDIESMS
jgi:hypothetical protein